MADDAAVVKIGTIVKEDPSLRFSKAGRPFTKFSLQVKPYVPKGQPAAEAVYYEVTCFGSTAENVAESMRKGYRVIVIGTGKLETWTGNDGNERTTKTILADEIGPSLRFVTATLGGADSQVAEDRSPF